MTMRLKADFNQNNRYQRQWHNIFKVLRENHQQPGIFYSAKLLFKTEGKHTVYNAQFLAEKIIRG